MKKFPKCLFPYLQSSCIQRRIRYKQRKVGSNRPPNTICKGNLWEKVNLTQTHFYYPHPTIFIKIRKSHCYFTAKMVTAKNDMTLKRNAQQSNQSLQLEFSILSSSTSLDSNPGYPHDMGKSVLFPHTASRICYNCFIYSRK